MKKYLRSLAILIAILMAGTSVAGCGNKADKTEAVQSAAPSSVQSTASTETSAESKKVEKVTIGGMAANTWINPGTEAMFKAIEAKTGITLEIQKLPDNGADTVLKTKLAANDVPEIIVWHSGAGLAGINPESNLVDNSGEPWADSIYDTLKTPLTINGKLYGPPWVAYGLNVGGVFYNKKVFEKAGAQIPKTWDEFLAVCDKIKAAGTVPVYSSVKETWSIQLFNLLSAPYIYDEVPDFAQKVSTNKLKFVDTPSYVRSLGLAKELKDKGYYNKDYLSAVYDNAIKALANGEAAMYPMGSWIMDQIYQKFPDKINDIGAFALPYTSGDPKATIWAGGGVYISKAAKKMDAAKTWISTYCDPAIQSEYYKVIKSFPGIKGVTVDGLYPAQNDLKKYMDEGKSALALEFLMTLPINGLDAICADVIIKDTAEAGAKRIDAAVEKQGKATKAPGWE